MINQISARTRITTGTVLCKRRRARLLSEGEIMGARGGEERSRGAE